MEDFFWTMLLSFTAYLTGSLPFGLILTRLFTPVDIQKTGSGNIGATNVYRTTRKQLGVLTLLLDMLKGFLPVLAGRLLIESPMPYLNVSLSLIGWCAFSGHLFPIYLKGKGGGKGVATAGGFFLALNPYAFGIAVLIFILCFCMTSRVSVASLLASLSLPILLQLISGSLIDVGTATLIAVLIVMRHKENILRLIKNEEPPMHF